jgi:hypothetical protein
MINKVILAFKGPILSRLHIIIIKTTTQDNLRERIWPKSNFLDDIKHVVHVVLVVLVVFHYPLHYSLLKC